LIPFARVDRRSAAPLVPGEVPRDVLSDPAYTTDQRGRERELEKPAHEVQTGLAIYDAPFVHRLSALIEDRKVDLPEVWPETRAPHHVPL
jgi:hypothetical protein